MDRPRRRVARKNYKTFNTFGTSDSAVQSLFQNMEQSQAETTESEIELSVKDEDMLDLLEENAESDEQPEDEKLSEAAGGVENVPFIAPQSSSKHDMVDQTLEEAHKILTSMASKVQMRTTEVNQDSEEELELRVKLLEEKKKRLRKEQLSKRIKELEQEVATMSNAGSTVTEGQEEQKKKKKKKSKGEVTIKDLRKRDDLTQKVTKVMRRLGLDSESETEYETADPLHKKYSKIKTEKSKPHHKSVTPKKQASTSKVVSKSEKQSKKVDTNVKVQKINNVSLSKNKDKTNKIQKVVQTPDSTNLKGESSTTDSVSDSDSSKESDSSDSSDFQLSYKLSQNSKDKKKLKSGLVVKSTEKVVNPQSFPHNFLQYEYVSKDIEFKQLNFKLFVAGELEIINNFCKDKHEKQGRLKLLKKIAYFSSTYQWASVLDFYAAWLRQIELGRKSWKDDPQVLENIILSGHTLSKEFRLGNFKQFGNKPQTAKDSVWFCVKYQRNKCEYTKSPHPAMIRGINRMVQHICATCLQKDNSKQEHPECSDICPNRAKK